MQEYLKEEEGIVKSIHDEWIHERILFKREKWKENFMKSIKLYEMIEAN
jgi:hypothetical protein